MSKNGLKIKNEAKTQGQLTLAEAFEAGRLICEAKTKRRQVLNAQEEILVS